MGSSSTEATDVARALFGKTRRSILALLLARPDESFYLREVVRETQCGQGGVQRELKRLESAGILSRTVRGRATFYLANQDCPLLAELRGLVLGTGGASTSAGLGQVTPPPEHPLQVAQPSAVSEQTVRAQGTRWTEDMPSELL